MLPKTLRQLSCVGRVGALANIRVGPRCNAPIQFSRGFSQVKFKDGEFRSNAEGLISKVPVIEVEEYTAQCTGGGGALGHPIEYIQLNTVKEGDVATCKYCGLRFVHKHGSGHH